METLFLCSRELVKKQGRGYDFTISENESTILLFLAKRENDFTLNLLQPSVCHADKQMTYADYITFFQVLAEGFHSKSA